VINKNNIVNKRRFLKILNLVIVLYNSSTKYQNLLQTQQRKLR